MLSLPASKLREIGLLLRFEVGGGLSQRLLAEFVGFTVRSLMIQAAASQDAGERGEEEFSHHECAREVIECQSRSDGGS